MGAVKRAFRQLISANRRAAGAIEPVLLRAEPDLQREYEARVTALMNARPGLVVVDVGGGRRCHFARFRDPESGARLIAVDVSPEELAHNREVDETRVADVQQGLPLADAEADLIVSRSVLEHLQDVEAFIRHAERALKPGGYFVHLLPGRNSPHSIANRLLPREVARLLVHTFIPGSEGRLGFPAYYDRCTPAGLTGLLERHGFEVEQVRVGYYQSDYYAFLLPLYLLSALYELAVRAAGARELAATFLVVARRR